MIPKILSEKTKYHGKWLDVIEQNIDIGSGKIVSWETLKTNDAVATVALDDKNNVFLGKEYKVAHKDFIYTLAAGFAEKQGSEKDLKEQARKELREEFGINAKKIEKLATVIDSGRNSAKWHIYVARNLFENPLKKDEGETIERIKVPLSKAVNLLLSNKSHFVALLGILLVKEKLKL